MIQSESRSPEKQLSLRKQRSHVNQESHRMENQISEKSGYRAVNKQQRDIRFAQDEYLDHEIDEHDKD